MAGQIIIARRSDRDLSIIQKRGEKHGNLAIDRDIWSRAASSLLSSRVARRTRCQIALPSRSALRCPFRGFQGRK